MPDLSDEEIRAAVRGSWITKPGPCNDPDCDDGYVFHPPLQEGALGCVTPCQQCANAWRRYWDQQGDKHA